MTQVLMPTAREEKVEGSSGLNIFVRSWRPHGAARAVVVICHGLNAHSGQYQWVGEQFAAASPMNADPLIADEVQPTRTAAELARADDRLKREFPLITLPVLILHGTPDRVTKPSGSRLFYDMAGSADKTLKLYEGHYHDLLNDIDKEKVLADITGWLDSRVPTV
jgi:alpha-beta hydrolase superfamily lysophospholipase